MFSILIFYGSLHWRAGEPEIKGAGPAEPTPSSGVPGFSGDGFGTDDAPVPQRDRPSPD
ncbi:MAG: hypothetical protein ACRDEA_12210 [Microcystaceae cyanobacterium]